MTDKIIETTDREVGHFIEELSRIMRNVKLIKQGKTHTIEGVDRLDIIDKCAKDINDRCCKMQHYTQRPLYGGVWNVMEYALYKLLCVVR